MRMSFSSDLGLGLEHDYTSYNFFTLTTLGQYYLEGIPTQVGYCSYKVTVVWYCTIPFSEEIERLIIF